MEYTMALTRRHLFPAEAKGTIYPSADDSHIRREGETNEHYMARMDAWADFVIPQNCTKLKVYMSGYKSLHQSLRRVCKARGVECIALWPTDVIKEKYIRRGVNPPREVAMNPTAYTGVKMA